MKKLLALLICLMLTLSLFACGGDTEPIENNEDQLNIEDSNNDTVEDTESQEADSNIQPTENKNTLSTFYEAYHEIKSAFDDHILEQSTDHEVVSVSISIVSPSELKLFSYLLPLSLIGSSSTATAEFDKDMELLGLQVAWLDDADINYDGAGNYQLSGTDRNDDRISVKIMHDIEADSIRLEGYKNETLELIFEYVKTSDGYAAQYYYEDTTGSVKFQPIIELCNYKLLFDGENGTYARFDGVESEPASIYCNAPDASTFTEGATHWFTLTDGQFTGNISGTEF